MNTTAPIYNDDRSDIEAQNMRISAVLQQLSGALAPDSDWPDAKAGDLLFFFQDRTDQLYPRVPGARVQLIASVTQFVEWEPSRSAKKPPVANHDVMPLDAQWIEGANRRKSCLRPNGNRVERTIYTHMLVDGRQATVAFKSTGLEIGERWNRDADRVRVQIDGTIVRMVGAFYQMSAEYEKNSRGEVWWQPTYARLGLMGQAGGPTLDEVRVARDLRFEIKGDLDAKKARLSAPPTRTPALALGHTSFSSGVQRPEGERRSWADPQAPGEIIDQPATTTKAAEPNDDIPF
jgi:hypothetical protein